MMFGGLNETSRSARPRVGHRLAFRSAAALAVIVALAGGTWMNSTTASAWTSPTKQVVSLALTKPGLNHGRVWVPLDACLEVQLLSYPSTGRWPALVSAPGFLALKEEKDYPTSGAIGSPQWHVFYFHATREGEGRVTFKMADGETASVDVYTAASR